MAKEEDKNLERFIGVPEEFEFVGTEDEIKVVEVRE